MSGKAWTQAGVMEHSFNVSTWEAQDRWISWESQASQGYIETLSQNSVST